jgi:hypothetical protein
MTLRRLQGPGRGPSRDGRNSGGSLPWLISWHVFLGGLQALGPHGKNIIQPKLLHLRLVVCNRDLTLTFAIVLHYHWPAEEENELRTRDYLWLAPLWVW